MTQIAIVDTGVIYAAADRTDPQHLSCLELLERLDFELVIPTLVIGEACYLAASRMGARAELLLAHWFSSMRVEAIAETDWPRILRLVEQYADFPLGVVDASVVALAERLDAEVVMTLDQRHFRAVRPRHRESLALLP